MNGLHKLSIFTLLLLPIALHAQLVVDCSGTNPDPSVYPSINAALPNAGQGSTILVSGTCNESVALQGMNNISLGAWWGQTASVTGGILISNSNSIYLY